MSIRPMSAFPDFRFELEELLEQAREAGLEDDQLAGELRERAAECDRLYDVKYPPEED